jgi:hypothetical protein
MMKSVLESIKKITTEANGLKNITDIHQLNGTFRLMADKKKFQELVFPGTSPDVLRELPKDLVEILRWKELKDILDYSKIAKNAAEVLINIKIKGAKQGDKMDEMTEKMLTPQIAQEALAKGIVETVRTLTRVISAVSAKFSDEFASTSAPEASYDQIDVNISETLLGVQKFVAQPEFLGSEWSNLVARDLRRYVRVEKMSSLDSSGRPNISADAAVEEIMSESSGPQVAWIDESEYLSETYPALAEVLKQLHALPYELNGTFFLCKELLLSNRDRMILSHVYCYQVGIVLKLCALISKCLCFRISEM